MDVAIVTVSDRSARGERDDVSGPVLKELVKDQGWQVASYSVVQDDMEELERVLLDLTDGSAVDLILTTGGTGFGPRDITPEATMQVIEREAPGFAEVMRAESLKKTPHGMLSRGRSGIREETIIVNLPGSPKAVRECFAAIAPGLAHAVQLVHGDTDSGHDAGKTG